MHAMTCIGDSSIAVLPATWACSNCSIVCHSLDLTVQSPGAERLACVLSSLPEDAGQRWAARQKELASLAKQLSDAGQVRSRAEQLGPGTVSLDTGMEQELRFRLRTMFR